MGTNVCCDITPEGLVGLGMSFEDEFTVTAKLRIGVLTCVFNDDGYMYSEFVSSGGVVFDVPVLRLSDMGAVLRIFG